MKGCMKMFYILDENGNRLKENKIVSFSNRKEAEHKITQLIIKTGKTDYLIESTETTKITIKIDGDVLIVIDDTEMEAKIRANKKVKAKLKFKKISDHNFIGYL